MVGVLFSSLTEPSRYGHLHLDPYPGFNSSTHSLRNSRGAGSREDSLDFREWLFEVLYLGQAYVFAWYNFHCLLSYLVGELGIVSGGGGRLGKLHDEARSYIHKCTTCGY